MEYVEIGRIVNTQGLKGELRVLPSTDDITRFELLDAVTVIYKDKNENLSIEKVRYHKQFVILKFRGLDTINDVERYKGYTIKIPKELALPLLENEYYIGDLIGMEIFTEEEERLGELKEVLFTGANDVYVIGNDEGEILIPAIKQCILDVDTGNRRMLVRLLEGLR